MEETGKGWAGNRLAKLARSKSLAPDMVSLCFGVVFLAGLVALAVAYSELICLWWYWCLYVIPSVLIPLNIYEIRRELNLRERVKNGEIEIVECGHLIIIRQKQDNKSSWEI